MPQMNTRHWALRKLSSAKNNLDWSAGHIMEVMQVYEKDHAEIEEALHTVVDTLAIAYECIERVKEKI